MWPATRKGTSCGKNRFYVFDTYRKIVFSPIKWCFSKKILKIHFYRKIILKFGRNRMYHCSRWAEKNLPLHLLTPHAWSCPCAYTGVVLFGQDWLFFVVVSGGGHFQDRPILPEGHDFSEFSLGSLVKFGFAALGPFSRGRSHINLTWKKL